MDHKVLPANYTMPAFFASVHQTAPTLTVVEGIRHPIAAHYSFIDPERMKG